MPINDCDHSAGYRGMEPSHVGFKSFQFNGHVGLQPAFSVLFELPAFDNVALRALMRCVCLANRSRSDSHSQTIEEIHRCKHKNFRVHRVLSEQIPNTVPSASDSFVRFNSDVAISSGLYIVANSDFHHAISLLLSVRLLQRNLNSVFWFGRL
jgi:hypothetical protein